MPRYFIEVSYNGARYSGSQAQHNAITVQHALEAALRTLSREAILLTGSSRTDAGVHALQNFYHFDASYIFTEQMVYRLNAILPGDIAVQAITAVPANAHCRFDALQRQYAYHVYRHKNPFLQHTAFFYPYPVQLQKMNEAAALLPGLHDFTSFSKRNTQVQNFNCNISYSYWEQAAGQYIFRVAANRFLRGMVRALTATLLRVGRGTLTIAEFERILLAKDNTGAYFDAPAHGLFLEKVLYHI